MSPHTLLGVAILCQLSAYAAAQTNFVVVGNWGNMTDQTLQKTVGDQMGEWAQENGCDFILSTGDNFFPAGVDSNQSSRFDLNWRDVYNHPGIGNTDWYISAGNHDHGPDFRELYQVEFSEHDSRWNFPYIWYTFGVTDDSGATLDFIIIDTEALVSNRDVYDNTEQLTWLEAQLESSTADWVFVIGHHPAVSSGLWPLETLVYEEVVPILEEHGADFFLSGHNMNLEHVTKIGDEAQGVHYVISGGGMTTNPSNDRNEEIIAGWGYQVDYFADSLGFTAFEVDGSTAVVSFYDHTGYLLYDFVRTKP